MQYRELLQLVMHSLSKPGAIDSNQQLGNISRKIAQCVTELATAAEQLKDDDWVNPSDPNWIAENELLGAAKAIENAAKKLAMLKPRTKIVEGKVSTKISACFAFSTTRKVVLALRWVITITTQGSAHATLYSTRTTFILMLIFF